MGIQHMATNNRSTGAATAAAALLLLSLSGEAVSAGSCLTAARDGVFRGEVSRALASFGARVIAVGRVDSVSRDQGVEVLGLHVIPSSLDSFQVGDYAIVVDWTRRGSRERVMEVRALSGRYVPGASEVFLKTRVTGNDVLRAQARLGLVNVDYTSLALAIGHRLSSPGSVAAVRGTQPQPRGAVLSRCLVVSTEGSLGTGRLDGSLGTGRTDGSLGTGRADGSLGTGRLSGSLGTGRTDGSLGTGKTDGSLGTGRTDGSLGTGRVDGSLDTGLTNGSLGTGKSSS